MNSLFIITASVVLLECLLALIVYLHNSREHVNRMFAFFICTVIFWTISNWLVVVLVSLFWTRMSYVASMLGMYVLLRFVDTFVTSSRIIVGARRWILDIASIVIFVLTLVPSDLIISGIDPSVPGVG